MKVFISWSSETSKHIAKVIWETLRNALQFVQLFFSPVDIDKGAWSRCLTDGNG